MRLCGGGSLAHFRLTSCDTSSLKATSAISRAATRIEHLEVHVERLHCPSGITVSLAKLGANEAR